MPDTDLESPTIQQAFEQAKEEHSRPEHAPPADASTASAATPPPAQHTDAADVPATAAAPETPDLITEADFSAMQTRFPNDPAKQRAELNRVWTQKTQALATERKALEPLQQWHEAYTRDPQAAITDLAARNGLTISPTPQQTQVTATAHTIAESMAARVKQELGPDLDFLAEPLTRAFKTMAEEVAKTVTEQAVGPLKTQQDQLLTRAAVDQTATVMQTFERAHPDWKAHEPALVALSQQLQPNGMSELAYLDLLYSHVTRDQQIASATKAALERMSRAADSAEAREHPPSENRVTVTSTAPQSIAEAYAMAKRGERVE